MSRPKNRGRAIVATAATIALALVIVSAARLGHQLGGRDVLGLRLGMTAEDARAALTPHGEGSWTADAGGALEWHATSPAAGRPDRIRLELHENALAAVRVSWPPGTSVPDVARQVGRSDRAPTALTVWDEGGSVEMLSPDAEAGISYLLIDPNCPTHRAEADGLRSR